ncbi:hypothetical protein A2291_04000 [candidate division WOR-1 bacterium RIFOXYB2_FULL_42_35]|uniref:Haloacid dehalogenase n=1 Tax=candidate division WOR-1 bacterium RIFOXYC2_FULL_41_25 TaxID=1802586 RepID=A0A1F4TN18_UNCSA|nr:MAG: hypothetical protein A2247_00840 [candidate division WOR-1 bacterium RIFOXYA2_FULL_41_14]OGC24295.1 MAG: hypothetical protein A2291_04000 [candidate division WOR-1 bacterium RIFOXYB2_FULL_42_35]OGC33997.1 MAG: hypothetical protein A2462_01405 [candidate division WOR-1 bacterium RIFOXYC2_FULL_41_25]OGC43149.1 MAG: hypothetical protein A2548_01780 [candidate division WOR-1 bacterium RIFOXYD2_FULL_41_8]
MINPVRLSIREIIRKHSVFLIDNFGVLKTASGLIAGTAETIREIKAQGKRAIILSNTASEPPEDIQRSLKQRQVDLELENIITSGMVLKPHFQANDLVGANIFNVGNQGGADYITQAGGVVLAHQRVLDTPQLVKAVVITRQELEHGADNLIPTALINAAINILRYRPEVQGIIANPDLTAPVKETEVRMAAGALGFIIEACSGRLLARLGKPYLPIYELAFSLVPDVPKEQILMIDDSLEYGIRGARNAGIKSLLVMTGNTRTEEQIRQSPDQPDFVADSFSLAA